MAQELPEYPDSDFSDDELSPLEITFNNATNHVRKLTSVLNNNQLLELYGLFKQGTEGSCNTPKPSWYDGKGRKKWEAWRKVGDLPCEQAKEDYVTLVEKLDPSWCKQESLPGTKDSWVAVSSLWHSPEPDLVNNQLSILDAARDNCHERVRELLKQDADLWQERDVDGMTALHWATDRNATDALQAALDCGCPVDALDYAGQTALHYAASCGHVESTRILIMAGATLLKDEDGQTPLDIAENEEIKRMLEDMNELD